MAMQYSTLIIVIMDDLTQTQTGQTMNICVANIMVSMLSMLSKQSAKPSLTQTLS